jgi:DNA modification methylase
MPDPTWRVIAGDCRSSLASLPAGSVQTCVTSPPYFGLRDYGTGEWEGGTGDCDHSPEMRGGRFASPVSAKQASNTGSGTASARECPCGARRVDQQIGLEPTPDEFVAALVEVFREVRRVLRDDGTVWLNLGDSYCAATSTSRSSDRERARSGWDGAFKVPSLARREVSSNQGTDRRVLPGVKQKDLIGIPWMVAFALRADGWYLRSDIIWAKPNPMPESVTDRPTKAHEYLFLLSRSLRYYYDYEAVREPHSREWWTESVGGDKICADRKDGGDRQGNGDPAGRNKRSVWTIATQPFAGAHFATFPPKLIEPCILAGTSPKSCGECGAPWRRVVERTKMVVKPTPKREAWQAEDDHARTQTGGTMVEPPTSKTIGWESSCDHDDDTGRSVVLDPFAGSGTVGVVCGWHGRDFIGLELSETYAEMARDRITAEGKPWRPRSEPPKVHADQLDILSALGPG